MAGRLDRIDLKILRLLQNNGRLSNAELAETAGVSAGDLSPADPAAVRRRLYCQRPRHGGAAQGRPGHAGHGRRRTRPLHAGKLSSFEQAAAKLKCVLDCHLVAGEFDYFLKIRAGDIDDFKRIHGDQLLALPGVRQTRTFFVMKEVVDNAPLDF